MVTRLGVAWSPLLEASPDILDRIDYVQTSIELMRRLERIPDLPIILHGNQINWSLADPNAVSQAWLDEVNRAIEETSSPWFSLHLGFATERVRFVSHMLPDSEPLNRDVLLARFTDALRRIREASQVPLLVENLDYCPEGAYEHVCEPQFIAEAAEAADVGLLFDIGHFQVSASWLKFDPISTLMALPLARIREIHVSSPRELAHGSGRLDDIHEHLLPRDYDLLNMILNQVTPAAITLEYRRDHRHLSEQIEQLRHMITLKSGEIAE